MMDLFERFRKEEGLFATYSHLPEDYFFFPKLKGDVLNRGRLEQHPRETLENVSSAFDILRRLQSL